MAAREGQRLQRSEPDVGRQVEGEHGRVFTHKFGGEDEDELLGLEPRGGAEQRPDSVGVDKHALPGGEPALRPALGDADFKEGDRGRGARDALEGPFERGERDIVEEELAEPGPEATPPAGENAGPHGGADAPETREDEEEQVVGEGADAVVLSAAAAWAQLLGGTQATP